MSPASPLNLDELWEKHGPRIRRAALMLSGSPWDADDLTQETFLVVANTGRPFEGRSDVFTWLYGVLLNLDRRRRRRLGTQQRKLEDLRRGRPPGPPSVPAAESPLVAAEWKQSLWAHVHQLPEGQRQSLVLRFSEELKYEQIADILQCPVGTVKSRIFHGLLALKKSLGRSEAAAPPSHPNEDMAQRYGNPAS